MTGPRSGSVLCRSASGEHRLAYLAWGEERLDRTVVCVHGLTGNARDFDALAEALAARGHHVLCPDLVGRGASDRLRDPEAYGLRQYASDMRCLLERLTLGSVDWVGTSLGGLVGMTLASSADTPLRRLVVNDIGPFVPTAALQRLAVHLGGDPAFQDLGAAERWLREVRAPFGPLTDAQWRSMAERSVRPGEDGRYRLLYDPAIAVPFLRTADRDVDVWETWDHVACPVLVLRGEHSDLLLAATAAEMATRGPGAEVVEVAGCGHAPALVDREQIEVVTEWLGRGAPRLTA